MDTCLLFMFKQTNLESLSQQPDLSFALLVVTFSIDSQQSGL